MPVFYVEFFAEVSYFLIQIVKNRLQTQQKRSDKLTKRLGEKLH